MGTTVVCPAVPVTTEGDLSAGQACFYAFPRVRAAWTDSVHHNGVTLPPSSTIVPTLATVLEAVSPCLVDILDGPATVYVLSTRSPEQALFQDFHGSSLLSRACFRVRSSLSVASFLRVNAADVFCHDSRDVAS